MQDTWNNFGCSHTESLKRVKVDYLSVFQQEHIQKADLSSNETTGKACNTHTLVKINIQKCICENTEV